MRITSNQLANLVRESVAKNTRKLYEAQETVTTQKVVNRPSDDPLAMGRILDYRTTLASIDQYARNIDQAKMQVEFSETQLEEVLEQLSNAKTLLVGVGNGDEADRRKTADDIQDIYDRLLDMANTKLGDSYIFGGHQNGVQPIDCAEANCKAGADVAHGDYFIIGDGHYVWYDKKGDGTGDPGFEGMTGIEVDVSETDAAITVAANTAGAIDAVSDFACAPDSVYPERIVIEYNSNPDGVPNIAEGSSGFDIRTKKYEVTPPFTTDRADITFLDSDDIESGDYFLIGLDYYVWYNNKEIGTDDAPTDASLAGKTGIEVKISHDDDPATDGAGNDTPEEIAEATMDALNGFKDDGDAVFSAAVSEGDASRIEIELAEPADGSLPEISDVTTGFTVHTVNYNADDGDLDFAVSKTLKIRGNATGNEVFTGEGVNDGVNIFDTLKALKDALEAPSYDADRVADIQNDLIKGADQVERAAVNLSVAYTRLETTENYWDLFKVKVQDMLSGTEDADLAQAIVELQHQETVYEATLAASAKLFNKSLLDFLG